MPKHNFETIAAIDVGSNAIRMVIAQVTRDGKVTFLEDLYKPTHIGRDTFAIGRIQVSSIHELCDTLSGFYSIMKQYKIKNYRAASTSGIREAENREYVLEQVRVRSGLEVEVINNAQARFLMYKAVRGLINNLKSANEKGTLMVDIGSGGVEMSVYSKGSLRFTEYIKVGSLRLREILAELEKKTLDFPQVMEEFIESRFDFLKPLLSEMNINSFIGLGGELKTIIDLCPDTGENPGNNYINKEALKKLYLKVRNLTTSQLIKEFGFTRNQAEIFLPSVILFNSLLKMTKAEGINAPMGSLRHGLLADMVDEWLDTPGRREAVEDIINSVWHIGAKYFIDKEHCKYIEKHALSIYDQMKKIHRLGERERLYLRAASILHDIGKYVNLSGHDIHSYNIIRFQDIMGFSDRELSLVANIARYHSHDIPKPTDENYRILDDADQIIVSKLAAILRIAEALDISHKRKIKKVDVLTSEKEIHFNAWSSEDMLLEEWNFAVNVTFFEEVMGYRPVLKQRR
ncbi:MAG: HD domain-containing protein [Clostridia bacterium]|nr:HD domain-containing protein [Clostridia bacterium]